MDPEARVFAPVQAVGADHTGRALAERLVEHEKMIAGFVEIVEVAVRPCHLGCRLGAHLVVEDAIAQLLCPLHLVDRAGEPDLEAAEPAERSGRLVKASEAAPTEAHTAAEALWHQG